MTMPATLPMTTHYQGDRWIDGYRHFGPVSVNGSPPSDPCLYAEMKFVRPQSGSSSSSCVFTSESQPGEGKITIIDAVNYEFSIGDSEVNLPLSEGVWEWSFSTYCTIDKTDSPLTIWRGSIEIVRSI